MLGDPKGDGAPELVEEPEGLRGEPLGLLVIWGQKKKSGQRSRRVNARAGGQQGHSHAGNFSGLKND